MRRAIVVGLATLLLVSTFSPRALANGGQPAGTPNVIVQLPVLPVADVPQTTPSTAFDTATRPPAAGAAAQPARQINVQGPSAGSGYRYETATGPLNVAASLDSATCRGGPLLVSAIVSDESGNAVSGAAVSGYVQFASTGSSLSFRPTGDDGFTSMSFNSGNPHGGYSVVFSIHADHGSDSADSIVRCYAP